MTGCCRRMKALQELVDSSMSAIQRHQDALRDSLSMTQVHENIIVCAFAFFFSCKR